MKPIHSLAMLAIFILLGGYIFFFEQGPAPAPEGEGEIKPKENILSFALPDLQEVTLSRGADKLVLAQTKADEWGITAPQAGPADATRVKDALMPLSTWQAMETLAESLEPSKKKDFGLEPPAITLALKLKSGGQEVYIGSKTPTNTGYYVMVKGNPKLFLSFTSLPENLEKLLQSPPVPTPVPTAAPTGQASVPATVASPGP